ncbi:unnamed protein product [Diatraea saccharalis]|uniref:Organic cation transporter protein-like n=1 Tax=Diatraea saccharalis TaxID=40085 RepID=A0A9N9WCN5_9NEOP|nr:unnamed protein product [Diatraea saccharalis]
MSASRRGSVEFTEKPIDKPVDLDDILVNELGQFGRFQMTNLLLVAIPLIMSAFMTEYIFSAAAVPHRCMISECGEEPRGLTFHQEWISNAIPETNNGFSSCERFAPAGGTGSLASCPANLFDQSNTQQCESFVYDRENSVVYEFNLGCQEWMRALAGTLSSVAAELVGPKFRVLTSATCSSMFAVGQVILGSVAWVVQPWRYMIMAIHIPCFLIIVYYWILSESVRWLLSKGRYEDAKRVLEKVARVNKRQISEKSLNALMNPPKTPVVEEKKDEQSMIVTVAKSPVLRRRVATTPIWWITTTFVYYGLSINSTSLSESMYLNYILTCAIEIPGFFTAVLLLDWIGRKSTLCGGFFLSAACNIAFAFIPSELAILRLILYLLGKFGISLVFTSLYLYTSELYPTQYRHSLLAFSSMIGRIGSTTAPLTPVLMEYWSGIPSIMFGTMGLLSGVLVLTQPETLGTKMPDTLAEAEALGRPTFKGQTS